jgi:hypothetical protein
MLYDLSTASRRPAPFKVLSGGMFNRKQLLVVSVGDALVESFWPGDSLLINRGFLSALDAAWVAQAYFSTGAATRKGAAAIEK